MTKEQIWWFYFVIILNIIMLFIVFIHIVMYWTLPQVAICKSIESSPIVQSQPSKCVCECKAQSCPNNWYINYSLANWTYPNYYNNLNLSDLWKHPEHCPNCWVINQVYVKR